MGWPASYQTARDWYTCGSVDVGGERVDQNDSGEGHDDVHVRSAVGDVFCGHTDGVWPRH